MSDESIISVGEPIPWCNDAEGAIRVVVFKSLSGFSPSFPAAVLLSLGGAGGDDVCANLDLAQLDGLIGLFATARKTIIDAGVEASPEEHARANSGVTVGAYKRPAIAPSGTAELIAAMSAWLNAPRESARAAAEVVTEDGGVRLLKTTMGEWGTEEIEEGRRYWFEAEEFGRASFAYLRGKALCDCGAEVDEDTAIDNGHGHYCPACATEASEEFARTRYRCVATDDGINGTCGWEGLGPETSRPDDETIQCPRCQGYVAEVEIVEAAPEAKP